MADGLTQTNKRLEGDYIEREGAEKAQRELEGAREEIWSYLDNLYTNKQTDKQTDGRTLLVPKVAIATEKYLYQS